MKKYLYNIVWRTFTFIFQSTLWHVRYCCWVVVTITLYTKLFSSVITRLLRNMCLHHFTSFIRLIKCCYSIPMTCHIAVPCASPAFITCSTVIFAICKDFRLIRCSARWSIELFQNLLRGWYYNVTKFVINKLGWRG